MIVGMMAVIVVTMVMIMMIVIAIRAAGVLRIIVIEEMRIIVERPAEIEGAAIEHGVERHGGAFGAVDPR